MKCFERQLLFFFLFLLSSPAVTAQCLQGIVTDARTGEALVGVLIEAKPSGARTVTDVNGRFTIDKVKAGTCEITVSYLGYKKATVTNVKPSLPGKGNDIAVKLMPDEQQLAGVTITGVAKRNTLVSAISSMKASSLIVSNISAQEISRTQDSNAGEVIKRIPGVSIIEDKFVMVRGLSQRYNNVWINGGAVPSSEADSRAFSFDMIPSNQIENLTIVKTTSPSYPADYSGGFILINTKDIPSENSVSVQVGGNWNTASSLASFTKSKGSGCDLLGFDSGLRSLKGGINAQLRPLPSQAGIDLQGNGLNNDWTTATMHPLGDLKLGFALNRRWLLEAGGKLGMIATVNYTNEYRTYRNMKNNLFGIYDAENDRPNYLRRSVDDQYNNNVRLGALLNFTLLSSSGSNKYELKNIFNQLGNNRYTWREGVSAQANQENSAEYYYRSRTTYNGQLTGRHMLTDDEIAWSASYSYANRYMPDRRRYLIDDALQPDVMALSNGNDISREWTKLDEHIVSAAVSDKHKLAIGALEPVVEAGAYAEYRTRTYATRHFIYNWDPNNSSLLPANFRTLGMPKLLSSSEYYGEQGLYLLEVSQMRNNYRGHNTQEAGYISGTLPVGQWTLLAGVRYEHNDMELITNSRDDMKSESGRHYRTHDFFPSLNVTCHINNLHQLRASYGRSINRPEFRELSPAVFYDFDLASSVQGNTELKNCYIENADLRYEFYPSRGEVISVAAFFKYFDKPIEWTYTVAGGTDLIYSYKNAKSATSFGVEVDIKKDLTFIGLPGMSWSFNGALIHSRVKFAPGDPHDKNRPMQGQSPYLVNTGLFYTQPAWNLELALLYNRIGKRLIGVGRSSGTTGDQSNARVPDSYEMPRNMIDLTATKHLGRHFTVKLNVRDLLNEKVRYKQIADVTYPNGSTVKKNQVARSYRPGTNIGITAIYKF